MKELITSNFTQSIEIKQKALEENLDKIAQVAQLIIDALKQGNKVLFFGNGGSAADAQHVAAEFIGRFQKERQALGAIALTTDTSILTALSNDYSFDLVFARQIEGLGKKGDVAFGISTSGNSGNVIEGIKKAKELGIHTVTLTGKDGGKLGPLADINLNVSSDSTARIQESHLCIEHTICELVENALSEG